MTACFFLLAMLSWPGIPGSALAQSDDDYGSDDSYGRPAARTVNRDTMRIGVLDIRSTFDAERHVNKTVRSQLFQALIETTEQINAVNRVVIPNDSLMKLLDPRQKLSFRKCWINRICLAKVLKPNNLDIIVASKLRMKKISEGTIVDSEGKSIHVDLEKEVDTGVLGGSERKPDVFAEYSLFVVVFDTQRGRKFAEVFVQDTDTRRLRDKVRKEMYDQLKRVGLIREQEAAAAGIAVADDEDAIGPEEPVADDAPAPVAPVTTTPSDEDGPIQYDDTTKTGRDLKIAAWTTFGAGILAEGLGVTFTLLSKQAHDKAMKTAATSKELQNLRDDQDTYGLSANILYGVGGGLLATSLVLFILDWTDVLEGGSGGSGGGVAVTPDGVYVNYQLRF